MRRWEAWPARGIHHVCVDKDHAGDHAGDDAGLAASFEASKYPSGSDQDGVSEGCSPVDVGDTLSKGTRRDRGAQETIKKNCYIMPLCHCEDK